MTRPARDSWRKLGMDLASVNHFVPRELIERARDLVAADINSGRTRARRLRQAERKRHGRV